MLYQVKGSCMIGSQLTLDISVCAQKQTESKNRPDIPASPLRRKQIYLSQYIEPKACSSEPKYE
jgi:hypothetical protein